MPVNAWRTDVGGPPPAVSRSSSTARSRANRGRPDAVDHPVARTVPPHGEPAPSAQRRTVCGLALSRRAAWPMLYDGTPAPQPCHCASTCAASAV